MDRTTRMQFFAIALLLQALSDSKAMERITKIYASYSHEPKTTGLLLGYKLIIEATLYRQIELIVTCPEILHLQVDDDLCRWWLNSEEKFARRFQSVAEDDAPKSTFVANYINDLLLRVFRTGNRWKEFTEVSADVLSFAETVLSMTRHCQVTLNGGSGPDLNKDIDRALRLCAAEYLHDLVYDVNGHALSDAFDYTSNGSLEWVEGSILEDIGMSSGIDTSRDDIETQPRRLRGLHKFSGLGINAALGIALHALTNQKRVICRDDSKVAPVAELFGDVLEEFQLGKWPSTRYGLVFQNEMPEKELEGIMLLDTSPSDAREYLKALLGNNAFLVNGMSSGAAFHFQVLIEGLVKAGPTGTPVAVLQMEHAGLSDETHPPVSLAVRVGHDWHVFYYIDAVGRMKSWVWSFLNGLGNRVRITRIEGVSTEFLLCLCDRPFQYVSRQWKSQKDLNTHLRGVIPELLVSLLLVRLNHFPIRTSFELKGIGELDAIGYKGSAEGGKCKVVEVKKQSTNQIQLRAEIEEFIIKIQSIQQDRGTVEEALGCPGSIETVSGIFISMAEIGDLTDAVPDNSEPVMRFFDTTSPKAEFKSFLGSLKQIEFWDYNRFNRELEMADLPKLPIRLLEDAKLTWILPSPNLDEQFGEWDVLQKAVENDNWLWPDSSDTLMGTLDDILRHE